MSELKITQEKVTAAFSEANDCPKAISILTALFGKQKPDYTDYHNIKTYEDACEAIGVKPIVRLLVEDEDGHKEEVADIAHLAYIKLCTIARALNNDPDFPRFTKDEYRYTPWFYLYNQKEIDEMDEEDRNRLVLWGGSANNGASCGLAFASSYHAWSYSYSGWSSSGAYFGLACAHSSIVWSNSAANLGSRLAVKSNEIAIYFGEQFKELWKDFLIGKK